jgi:hypothetical protein
VNDPLEMNIAGRVMLLLSQLGIRDTRSLSIYLNAVKAAVRHRAVNDQPISLGHLEPFLSEQLEMLVTALRRRRGLLRVPMPRQEAGGSAKTPPSTDEHDSVARRPPKPASGYVPVAKSMEEKLKDDRKPVQKLLVEDCVAEHLLDRPKAEELIAGMTGKTPQDAELEIVEYLRQELQSQVRHFIRSDKGGPWSSPHAQEDLRKDIHAAKSVRGVLMLCRQIVKEHQDWEREHGHGGILGLFSPRRHLHGA